MKAILNGKDNHLYWQEVDNPIISGDQVLLKVHAAGVNRADLLQRAGQYPPPPGWPNWFGLEAAGEIVDIGEHVKDENKWHIGDKVCALLGGGGYAEYVAVPSGMLMPIPKGSSMVQAAAMPEVFGAAYLFLFIEGHLKAGETLLILAGASGVASIVIPIAKSMGVRTITTVINDEQEKAISHLNADIVVNTSRDSLSKVMKKELEGGHPVDVAIDCLGGDMVGKCLPLMNRRGRWIIIATLASDYSSIDLKELYVRGTRLIGTTLRSRSSEEKAELLSDMVKVLWPKVESGEIVQSIYKVYPMQQAEEAQDLMLSGKSAGKIVLTL